MYECVPHAMWMACIEKVRINYEMYSEIAYKEKAYIVKSKAWKFIMK